MKLIIVMVHPESELSYIFYAAIHAQAPAKTRILAEAS
jgi:hypothetical protein